MHPYLNHLNSDLCRGILELVEGRLLGKSGLHWLKIHLANLYARVDKLSYEGQVAFTENHLEDIFDSVDVPLEGRRWWLSAQDPLQCSCINLSKALRSSLPKTTISHMLVHQVLHSQHDHIQTEKCLPSEIKLIPPPSYSTQPHNKKEISKLAFIGILFYAQAYHLLSCVFCMNSSK